MINMRRLTITACLITALALEGQAQTTAPSHLLVCSNGVCILVPVPSVPQAPVVQAQAQPMPTPLAVRESQGSHAKAIVLTVAISAVGTWAIYKLFKRKANK